jgi:hypothetical protein
VLFDEEGNDCSGDPDRGWETQSSESESNQAASIATEIWNGVDLLCGGHRCNRVVVVEFRVSFEFWSSIDVTEVESAHSGTYSC